MTTVAVVAHSKKSFGGGLDELRSVLAHEGVEPLWFEVSKSRKAPKAAREAVAKGADLVFVWGGDGMVHLGVTVPQAPPVGVLVVVQDDFLVHRVQLHAIARPLSRRSSVRAPGLRPGRRRKERSQHHL